MLSRFEIGQKRGEQSEEREIATEVENVVDARVIGEHTE